MSDALVDKTEPLSDRGLVLECIKCGERLSWKPRAKQDIRGQIYHGCSAEGPPFTVVDEDDVYNTRQLRESGKRVCAVPYCDEEFIADEGDLGGEINQHYKEAHSVRPWRGCERCGEGFWAGEVTHGTYIQRLYCDNCTKEDPLERLYAQPVNHVTMDMIEEDGEA